ncbi:hypothetical protein OAA27_00955 [bacterium]|nr:hypothetical protein [bacterium]
MRQETDVTRKGFLFTSVAVLFAVGAALAFRFNFADGPPNWAVILGALFLGPPLVWSGYSFVRNSELAPYVGSELRNRVLILSLILAALWLVYALIPSYVLDLEAAFEMSYLTFGIIFCIMVAMGATASVLTFELEFSEGLAHAGLYLLATMALAVLSGITLATAG